MQEDASSVPDGSPEADCEGGEDCGRDRGGAADTEGECREGRREGEGEV